MIIIDATSASKRITGIERYTIETSWRVSRLAESDGLETTLILARNSIYPEEKIKHFTECLYSPYSSRVLTEQLWLPSILSKRKPKFAFYPAFPPGLLSYLASRTTSFIHTVHDAVMWKHAGTLSIKNKLYMRPLENFGMPRYKTIETVSEFSKREISLVFPQHSEKIHASGNGVTSIPTSSFERMINGRYLLFVGTLEPRKNIPFLIDVFNDLLKIHPEVRLVIAGRKGWGTDDVVKAIAKHSIEQSIDLLGPVTDEQLSNLYAHAEIFVYPSLYEGFGLPVLEAMQAGLPVVSSDGGALPEAVGDGGIVISSTQKEQWVSSIRKILSDPVYRQKLVALGKSQAEKFSWDSVAQRIYSRMKP